MGGFAWKSPAVTAVMDGAESMGCGGSGCNQHPIGSRRAATGNEFFYYARIMLMLAMIEAKGFLLRVENSSHFKGLIAGRKIRAVHFPVMKLR